MTAETSKRLPRLRRLEMIFVRAPIYFVTASTYNRRDILAIRKIHRSFVRFGEEGPDHGAWIGAYVLMPDHFHAFVRVDAEQVTLSTWMKSLKNSLSRALRLAGVEAPHWQKTFFDHILRSGESYSQKWEYVRENPVRAGLVKKWEEWPFRGEIFPLEFRRASA